MGGIGTHVARNIDWDWYKNTRQQRECEVIEGKGQNRNKGVWTGPEVLAIPGRDSAKQKLGNADAAERSAGGSGFLREDRSPAYGEAMGSDDTLCTKRSSQLKGTAAPGAQLWWSGQGRGCVCGWGGDRGYDICLFVPHLPGYSVFFRKVMAGDQRRKQPASSPCPGSWRLAQGTTV